MLKQPLDADAVEGARLRTSSTNAFQDSYPTRHQDSTVELSTPLTAAKSKQGSLDRSEGLSSDGISSSHLDQFQNSDHPHNVFKSSSSTSSHSLQYPSLTSAYSSMSSLLDQPPLDGHEDSDCEDMVSSQISMPGSPDLSSSLPFLVGRHVAQEQRDPEEASLSGDTVSNADTVSDRFDPAEDDSLPDYDQVTHDEIPAYLRETKEQDENLVLSDITVGPHTTATNSPSMHASTPSMSRVLIDGGNSSSIVVCPTADEPYIIPARPLRFLFVAEESMDEQHQLLIVTKLVTAMTGLGLYDTRVIRTNEDRDDSVQSYQINIKDQVIEVCVDHAVKYIGDAFILRKDQTIFRIADTPLPDFAIFFHVAAPRNGATYGLYTAILDCGIPMLEISKDSTDLSCVQSFGLVLNGAGSGGSSFLHLSYTPDVKKDSVPSALPVTLQMFLNQDDSELTRHLALISKKNIENAANQEVAEKHVGNKHVVRNRCKTKTKSKMQRLYKPEDSVITTTSSTSSSMGAIQLSPLTALKVLSVWLAIFLACRQYFFASTKLDPLSELTLRQEALSMVLNKSAIATVDASSVLHYPTTTGIVSGSTTIGVAFPTAVDVHVAKADQLFVSLPKRYASIDGVNIARHDNKTLIYNSTKLIDGVYVLDLKPVDAYGHVYLKFKTKDESVNETVKVWLGSRLAHRATYENVARHVQKDLQRDVEDAQNAARAVQARVMNGTHSALKVSAVRARAFRDKLVDAASVAARQLSFGYQGASNATARLAKSGSDLLITAVEKDIQAVRFASAYAQNATAAISSTLAKQIPAKKDFVRARNNSLKLKQKLLRRPAAPKEVVPWSYMGQFGKALQSPRQFRDKCASTFNQLVNKKQGKAHQKFKTDLEKGRKRHAKEWKGELITVDQPASEGKK